MNQKLNLLSVVSAVLISSFVVSSTSAEDASQQIAEQSLTFETSLTAPDQQPLVSTLDSEITPVSFSADQELSCETSESGCTCEGGCVGEGCCGYDCKESLFTRQYLTGDMFGARSCLAESGVTAQLAPAELQRTNARYDERSFRAARLRVAGA